MTVIVETSPRHDDGSATTRPTTRYWQRIDSAAEWAGRLAPPWHHGVPVRLPDGDVLELPIRELPVAAKAGDASASASASEAEAEAEATAAATAAAAAAAAAASAASTVPRRAVASLIANQASFDVVARLSRDMAELARPLGAEVVVGLPTLGMVFAPAVAQALGHSRYVPLGYSRKFWYDERLSTDVASITTPGAGKRVYLDPNQRALVQRRRAVVVDDAVSSGRTAVEVWRLLESLEIDMVGMVVAMRQGNAWRDALGPERAARVFGVFESPLLEAGAGGWWPLAGR